MMKTTRVQWLVMGLIALPLGLLSFKLVRDAWRCAAGERWLEAGCWLLVGTAPWVLVGILLISQRRKHGFWIAPRAWWVCRGCGYDLRKLPGEEKLCPECGTVNDRPW